MNIVGQGLHVENFLHPHEAFAVQVFLATMRPKMQPTFPYQHLHFKRKGKSIWVILSEMTEGERGEPPSLDQIKADDSDSGPMIVDAHVFEEEGTVFYEEYLQSQYKERWKRNVHPFGISGGSTFKVYCGHLGKPDFPTIDEYVAKMQKHAPMSCRFLLKLILGQSFVTGADVEIKVKTHLAYMFDHALMHRFSKVRNATSISSKFLIVTLYSMVNRSCGLTNFGFNLNELCDKSSGLNHPSCKTSLNAGKM